MLLLIVSEINNACTMINENIVKNTNFDVVYELSSKNEKCYFLLASDFDDDIKLNKEYTHELINILGNRSYYLLYFKEYYFNPNFVYVISTNIGKSEHDLLYNGILFTVKLLLLRYSFISELGTLYLNLLSRDMVSNKSLFRLLCDKASCRETVNQYKEQNQLKVSYSRHNNQSYVMISFEDDGDRSKFGEMFLDIINKLKHIE